MSVYSSTIPAVGNTILGDVSGINDNLDALRNMEAATGAPANTVHGMLWFDTNNGLVKQRNDADDAWITLWEIDTQVVYIADFTQALHDHADASGGGNLGNVTAGNLSVDNILIGDAAPSPPLANVIYKESTIKGWINFDMTVVAGSSERNSLNVSSLVDNAAGDWTVVWDRDFANVNYVAWGSSCNDGTNDSAFGAPKAKAVGSTQFIFLTHTGGHADRDLVNVIAMGDQ